MPKIQRRVGNIEHNMNKKTLICTFLCSLVLLSSCGGGGTQSNRGNLADGASGDMVAYVNSNVNAIEQARPSIMVIPGDLILKRHNCLKQENIDGVNFVLRDYQSYILKDAIWKEVVGHIQSKFTENNYPLEDFEQTLKQLNNRAASDMADNHARDSKALLLSTARPDIILELDYQVVGSNSDLFSHGGANQTVKTASYTLRAIDAYNNKVISSLSKNEIQGTSIVEAIQSNLNMSQKQLLDDIQQHYSDVLRRGRDVTVRILLDSNCPFTLADENIEGDTYTDWLVDYIKVNTIKGAYKMVINTNSELSFTNVRIPLLQEDGTQYGVYDWARDLQKSIRRDLGVKAINRSQGLGEVVLTINKL